MTQWLPIATAPKDGTRIIYWSKSYQKADIGYYRDGHIWTGTAIYSPSAIPREWHHVASHWMALPEAPEDAETPTELPSYTS